MFDPAWIVEESSDWLVVNKPAGLLTHAGADKSRLNLIDLLRQARPELIGLTLQHRLDKETSGLLLLTIGKELRALVAQMFAAHQVEKKYLCWVRGQRLPKSFVVNLPLAEHRGRVYVGPGKDALTEFELCRRQGEYCLLWARPKTGRKHQIRAHLAHRGWPILGDLLFGGLKHPRLLLHAQGLQLRCPDRGLHLSWTADPGPDFCPPHSSGC